MFLGASPEILNLYWLLGSEMKMSTFSFHSLSVTNKKGLRTTMSVRFGDQCRLGGEALWKGGVGPRRRESVCRYCGILFIL